MKFKRFAFLFFMIPCFFGCYKEKQPKRATLTFKCMTLVGNLSNEGNFHFIGYDDEVKNRGVKWEFDIGYIITQDDYNMIRSKYNGRPPKGACYYTYSSAYSDKNNPSQKNRFVVGYEVITDTTFYYCVY